MDLAFATIMLVGTWMMASGTELYSNNFSWEDLIKGPAGSLPRWWYPLTWRQAAVFALLCSGVGVVNADLLQTTQRWKGATLKPLSACCDIPELGDSKPLTECSNPKLPGPCNDVQCVFEKSGFLIDKNTLNKDAYRAHLSKWAQAHEGWDQAVSRAIADCVDRELKQYLDYPCKAYDVFTCTGIAMLKKCPESAWKC